MSLPDDVLRDAVLKTLADDVLDALKGSRTALRNVMETLKIRSLTAELPDGTKVAILSLGGGDDKPRITDPARFLAWVREAHPAETETVVRDSYRETLLRDMAKAGRAVDPKTGELVPGIEFEKTGTYVTPSFSKTGPGGREMIRRAWRDGKVSPLDGLGLPAVAAAPAEAPDAA